MATYTPGIPQPTDIPSQSQSTIADNFTAINDQFSVDHAGMVTPATGFHKKVTLPDQTASLPTSSAGQVVVYGVTNGSTTMPYYQRDGLATVFPVSPIKAFARINAAGTVISSWNITGNAVKTGTASNPVYTFTITRAMNSTNYGIMMTPSQPLQDQYISFLYGIASTTQFTIAFASTNAAHVPTDITVMVLEA